MMRNFPTSGAVFSEEILCVHLLQSVPCLSSPRTQRRNQSLRNKCSGGRAGSIQQQRIWRKKGV